MASTTDITLSHIGLLSKLKTTDKSNIVNAINELYGIIPRIEYGHSSFGDVPPATQDLQTVTFAKAFNQKPMVSIINATGPRSCTEITIVTTTQATFKFINLETAASQYLYDRGFDWIAIGI